METSGLMFPKPASKKRRKKHGKSILQDQTQKQCFLCMLEGDYSCKPVHDHHIFSGPGERPISEAHGFKANLCIDRHHQYGPEAVHVNAEVSDKLKAICQREFEKTHTHQEFMSLIGRNYL